MKLRSVLPIAAILIVVAAAVLLLPRLLQPSLEDQVADTLKIERKYLVLNVPPGPQRLPGSIFVAQRQFIPLDLMNVPDSRIIVGPDFNTEWTLKDWSSAQGSVAVSVASELVTSQAASEVSIALRNANLLEMSAPDLKKRLRESQAAILHGSERLVIVVRSVQAKPVVHVARNRNASLEEWVGVLARAKNVPGAKIHLEGQAGDEDRLSFETTEPVVFAFEIAKADYVLDHLGSSDAKVELTTLTGRQVQELLQRR